MKVLALTIFVGLILVGFFIFLWIAASCDPRQFSERDALLPLDDDDAAWLSRAKRKTPTSLGSGEPSHLPPS